MPSLFSEHVSEHSQGCPDVSGTASGTKDRVASCYVIGVALCSCQYVDECRLKISLGLQLSTANAKLVTVHNTQQLG